VGGEGNAAVQEPAVPHGASRPRRGRIQSREGRAPLLAGDKSSLTEGGGRPTACVAKRMHIADLARKFNSDALHAKTPDHSVRRAVAAALWRKSFHVITGSWSTVTKRANWRKGSP